MASDPASATTDKAKRWRIGRLWGCLLLVWIAMPAVLFLVAKAVDTPSTSPGDGVLVFVAAILITSFLPSLWVIRKYSSSRSISSHIARAAGFSVLTLVATLFVVVYVAVHSPK